MSECVSEGPEGGRSRKGRNEGGIASNKARYIIVYMYCGCSCFTTHVNTLIIHACPTHVHSVYECY